MSNNSIKLFKKLLLKLSKPAPKKVLFCAVGLMILSIGGVLFAQHTGSFSYGSPAYRLNGLKPSPTPPQPQTARPKRQTKTQVKENAGNGNLRQTSGPETGSPESALAQILASADFNLIGLVGTVNPPHQTVPKNVPTAVLTSIQVPEGEDPALIISQLNSNYRIRGDLTGPSLSAPQTVEARIGQQLPIPPLPNAGDHVLQNLRIIDITDPTRSAIAPVTPDSVGISVIDNILVTQVQVTEMTYEQIIQSGINLNNGNYNYFNFVIGLGTSSGTVPIRIPVALPTTGGQPPVVGNPTGGVTVGGVDVPLPDVVPIMLEGIDEGGNPVPVELPGGGTMQIPGVVVFPGRIGFLHQFFEAIVIVANGAPNGTPLVITNLRARANLPDSGTPANPNDDPLRIAETQQGGVQSQLEIHGLGPDGRYGTADDTTGFNPGQTGQAAFLLEGLREGLHTVNFDLEGTLQGLPSGNVTVRGSVPGAVLVRDAEFGVTFTHPAVIRAGQEYELGLTIYNSGSRNLNGISLNLRGNSVSGATLIDPEVKTLNQTILPGESGTVKWKLRSNTTGQVTASYIKVGAGIDAGLNLVTGVGDRNIPLSPDSLVLPEPVRHLPPDVVEAARQMLGQAWSIATAPAGSLPSGVLPVSKQTVVAKAVELGWAGLRIGFNEDRDTSLRTLLRDWLGENQSGSSTGFSDALRNTPAGYYFFDVVGTKFFETVGTAETPSDFHKKLVLAESSRSPFISAFVSRQSGGGPPVFGAKIISPTGQSTGFGVNNGERFGDLRAGAGVNLLHGDPHDATNDTKGNLLLVSNPATTGNWSLEINGRAEGAADISILTPTNGKNYRQILFGNVPVTAGKRYRISFRASGSAAPAIEEFISGAFQTVNLPYSVADVLDPNPEITGVIQVTGDVIEGGDQYGRLVGILFSKPMVKTSVESVSRYQIGGGELVSDPSQMIGRLITTTGAYQNFGERFSIISLDSPVGPFIRRTLTANGMVDKSGKIISSSSRDITMRVSPQGTPPGGYMTGRVMQADGTPVPNAGVYYQRMKPGFIGGMPTPPCGLFSDWETVSFQRADLNGEFTIDYVREGECHPVNVLFQNTATNSQKTLVSNVAYNGQHLIFNAVFLARGNVQGTVTSGGVPLANAYVSILSELDPLNNKQVRTDAQGFYSAQGVPVGGVTVKAVGIGTYSLSSGIAAGNLSEPGATVTIDVSTQNVSGVIKGKVLDGGSLGGQSPVPNSLVIARANIPGFPGVIGGIAVGYAFTAQDGSFTIDRLPIGNVYLEATDPQRGIGTSATVQLTEQNTRVEGIILSVSNGFGKVAGRVLNEIGQVIPNAVIQEGHQAVQADLSGNYVLPHVREGNVSIRATDPVTRQSGSTTITVRRGEDTNGADIIIRRPAFLNGQVSKTENGSTAPLAQAYVSDGRQIVRTDAQGQYQLSDVESGKNLTIRFVDPQGRLFVNTNVFLNPGETLSRNANFKPGRIHGKVTQPDGVTPVVTGVSFKTSKPHLGQNIFFGLPEDSNLSYQTGTDGLYAFENLNPIDYRVSASNVFFPIPVSHTGILPPNGDLEINLSLVDTLAGKVHGHIYKPDGTTPVGAGVKVSLGGGSLADVTVRTDANGYYEFAEVFAESGYMLTATDPLTNATNRIGINIKKNEEIEVDLRLLGRGNLKVKVIDGGGNPLQAGSLSVEGTGYPKDQRTVELTPINNGEFEFTNLNEGGYAISAEYNGLGGRVSGTVTSGGITEATVQIQAVGSVAGRVFMPDGSTPVGLADVTLKQNGRIIGLITTQDSEEERGKFSFDYVPAGDFTIDVFDNRSGRSGRTAGTISEQSQIANVSVNLLALGAVAGQVTSNGVPAAHALVRISADGSGISGTSRVATTDSDGRYRFPGIPVGRVNVYVSDGPGGLTGSAHGIISGTIEPLPDTVIDVALTPTAAVTGTVYKFGAAETFSGALVKITSGNFTGNTTTDETGRYRFDFVPLGNVSVRVESPFGYDRGRSDSIVSNEPGASITADIVMSGVGQINGMATDSGGNPLTFGKVTFTNTVWGENITALAPVQPDGTYSMAGLPTGAFTLKLTVPEIVGVGTAADILPGGQTLTKNLQLEPAGRVFGNVLGTNGTSPAIGADVVLLLTKQGGGSYTFITHTDSNGNWEINNLPLGAINIKISDSNSDGAASITGLDLSTNGQELNTGIIVLDNTPITVESVSPMNNAFDIPRDTTVQITFSEPVLASSVNSSSVMLKKGDSQVSSGLSISPDGRTISLTPLASLNDSTIYDVAVSTFVKDLNGLSLPQEFRSNFRTLDDTVPSVLNVTPPDASIQVATDARIIINTSEPIADDSNLSEIVLVSSSLGTVSGTISLAESGQTITFVPNSSLSESAIYTLRVNGLRDLAGNVQSEPFTSDFTTLDSTPPIIAPLEIDGTNSEHPRPTIVANYQDNASGINPASVIFTFDGVIITSDLNRTSESVRYVPPQNLSLGSHTVTVRVADNAGNLSDIRTATFTISDAAAPVVVSVSPADDANQVALNEVITVLFDEPLAANQDLSTILKVTSFSQSTPENGTYSLSSDGQTISFTPANLTESNRYVISVKNQKDVFGNTQNQAFYSVFTTLDTIAPVITNFTINNQQAVNGITISTPLPTFTVNYNDDIGIDTIRTKLYLNKTGEPLQEVTAQIENYRLTYKPSVELESGSYTVRAVIKDYAGNEAVNNEFQFNFAPQQPEILSISASGGPTSGNSVITISGSQLISGLDDIDDSQRGLLAEYYDCHNTYCLTGIKLVRLDETVNFDTFQESIIPFISSYNEAVRWRGKIIPRYTETYNFEARYNGHFIVKIDGNTVIDGTSFNVAEAQSQITFEANRSYDIEIQSLHFYQSSGGYSFYNQHVAQFFWSSPSQPREIVPAEQLRPAQRAGAPSVSVGGQPATVIGAVSGDTDQISIIIPPGSEGYADIQVQNDNGTATLSDEFQYYTDVNAPDFFNVSPPYGKLLTDSPARISVTFDEPLAPGGNLDEILKLYNVTDNVLIDGTVSIDETARRLRFVPTNPLPGNKVYRIAVEGQIDTVGNVAPYNQTTFTVDGAPPTVTFQSPGAVTFAQKPNISATISDVSGSVKYGTIKVFVDEVDVTGQTNVYYRCVTWGCFPYSTTDGLSYTPSANLSIGAHTARVQATDQAGNVANETLNFTISPDDVPPTITNVRIAEREYVEGFRTAVRQPYIQVYYQDNSLITPNRQKVYFGSQGGTLAQVATGSSQNYLFYYPPQELPFGFYTYRIELIDDQNNTTVRDINFEVADLDVTPPQITAVTPAYGAAQVDSNTALTLSFSEPLDPNQNFNGLVELYRNNNEIINGIYQLDAAGTILTFTPAEPLPDNSVYTVYAYNYLDLAGNGGQSFYSDFRTNDTEPPVIEPGQLYVDDDQWIELNGAEIFDRTPRIGISYSDATNYVDVNSIVFTLDGQQITTGVESWAVEYEPETPLSYGQHTITIQVADVIGNVSQLKTETFTVMKDPRTPFAVESDTTLLWRLDEADEYNTRITPDAGDYRIHGIFPMLSSLTGSKSAQQTGQKTEPKTLQKPAQKAEQKTVQKTADLSLFNPTQRGRFDGAVSYPRLTSFDDERIASLGNNGFTVEGWMKMTLNGAGNPYTIWAKGNDSEKDFELLMSPEGNLTARIYNASGETIEVGLPKETYDTTDNKWHSLAMTVESSGAAPNQLKLYIDGQLRAGIAVPQNFGTIRSSGGEFYLGFNSYYDSYQTSFDEVRVSSTAHSAVTISKTFNSADLGLIITRLNASVIPSGNTTDLIVEGYNLDSVTGMSFTDLNGNPLPITATIVENKKTSLKAQVIVDASVPNGDVRITLTDGLTTVSRDVRVAPQQAFTADAGTLILFNLNEPDTDEIVNSGTLGGTGETFYPYEVFNGRFGNGRNGIGTSRDDLSGYLNASFTTEFWVKTGQPDRDANLLVYGTDYDGLNTRVVEIVLSTRGELLAALTDSNELKWNAATQIGDINLLDDQWHLVSMVVTRDAEVPSLNTLKIYVDGVERAVSEIPAGFATLTGQSSYRFYANSFRGNPSPGGVDDFRLLNYPRTAAEIQNQWFGVSGLSGGRMNSPKSKNQITKETVLTERKTDGSVSDNSINKSEDRKSDAKNKRSADGKTPTENKSLIGQINRRSSRNSGVIKKEK